MNAGRRKGKGYKYGMNEEGRCRREGKKNYKIIDRSEGNERGRPQK